MPGSMKNAESPDAFVAALSGWRRELVVLLRRAATRVPGLDERIKWGNLVYFMNGPVLMIRAEPARVLFGFWRGQRLRDIEPRLKPGGKYEMATLELKADDSIQPRVARRLVESAVALNAEHGDPTDLASGRNTRGKAPKKHASAPDTHPRALRAAKPRGSGRARRR